MSAKPKLVVGAIGFLGSHVTRQLVADGAHVGAMVRAGANTRAIDDLELTRFYGDVFDTDTVRRDFAHARHGTGKCWPPTGVVAETSV